MKKTLTLVAMLMFWSTSALAINVQFDFDIFSSGQDIYACNAGLKHEPHAARVCFKRDDRTEVCNPNLCTTAEECDCVCTGSLVSNVQDGEWRLDFMKGTKAAWSDHGMAANSATPFSMIAGGPSPATANSPNNFNSLNTTRQARFNTELRSLSFQLGSERFGAEYFLDVCFRASQVDYSSVLSQLNHSLRREVTVTDLTDLEYSLLSGLEVKSVVQCFGKTSNADFSGNVVYSDATNWQPFNSNTAVNFGAQNIGNNMDGCMVRYYFRESVREGINSLRPWTAQEARVCTYTEFNESLD